MLTHIYSSRETIIKQTKILFFRHLKYAPPAYPTMILPACVNVSVRGMVPVAVQERVVRDGDMAVTVIDVIDWNHNV